jgi:hypothetical protein
MNKSALLRAKIVVSVPALLAQGKNREKKAFLRQAA